MNLPTGRELDRQWNKMVAEYKKWLLMATGKDVRLGRCNEILVKMQQRAVIVRRQEVMRRLGRVKFKANRQMPHIEVRIPGVND